MLVADDDRLARIALVCLLRRIPGVAVAGELADVPTGEALGRAVAAHRADVVIRRCVDGEPQAQLPRPPAGGDEKRFATIILSATEAPEEVRRAFVAGADAFLVEQRTPELLAPALQAVRDGGRFLDPELGARLAAEAAVGHPERDGALTSRERQVLTLLAAGKTNGEIALAIGISPRTVEGHRTRVGRKLGLRRRAELVEYALLHRLVPLRVAEREAGSPGTALDRAGSG